MTSRRFAPFALAVVLMLGTAPLLAQAQAQDPLAKRVDKLESEMRAVQRKVFPGGDKRYFEPEIATPQVEAAPVGAPASSPVNDLSARVDAIERQLQTLTSQAEQNAYRLRQLEEAMGKFRTDAEFRLNALEGHAPAATPGAAATPAAPPPAVMPMPATTTAAPVDPIEAEWNAAYALVKAKDYAKAEPALRAIIAKYPKHERGASAMFWLGRSYYAQGMYAQAAREFLESYNKHPRALRGPDSLYWVGQSLMRFPQPRPDKACEAYAELMSVYGDKLSASLKDQVAKARAEAKCI